MASVLRVLFGDESDSRKLTLVSGIPETVEDLHATIEDTFKIKDNFRMQYFDEDFKAFMNLTAITEITNKSVIKVITSPAAPEESLITLYPVPFEEPSVSQLHFPITSTPNPEPPRSQTPISSVASSGSDDTLCTSTPHSSPDVEMSGYASWPKVFMIPKFTYEAELELHQKNEEFDNNGKYHTPGVKLKSVILDFLAQEMLKYTKYPKDYQCEEVAAALTKTHPCLGQLGTKNGFWGWKKSLQYKMQNYRTKLGRLGDPEIRMNSLKHKREGIGKAAASIKKARKAETHYLPLYPKGETPESMETKRIALLAEVKQSDNDSIIHSMMEKTFSHRRLEIVDQRPRVADVRDRWPALFTPEGVQNEFIRITTKPLVSKFHSQMDHFTDKLLKIFQPKGGSKGQRIKRLLQLSEGQDIEIRREYILKSLMIYLNEDPISIFKDYSISEIMEAEKEAENTVMGIFVFRRSEHGLVEDVWIVLEGIKVLAGVKTVIAAFILLFGLIYALDLSYPEKLKYTFEFVQKIAMVMDGHNLNTKVQQLKIKMFM